MGRFPKILLPVMYLCPTVWASAEPASRRGSDLRLCAQKVRFGQLWGSEGPWPRSCGLEGKPHGGPGSGALSLPADWEGHIPGTGAFSKILDPVPDESLSMEGAQGKAPGLIMLRPFLVPGKEEK